MSGEGNELTPRSLLSSLFCKYVRSWLYRSFQLEFCGLQTLLTRLILKV
jgi:hypothetical protein